ncbi:GyrI-like domain-containing protein [Oricola sp.]|uniref:GyrI-like domain-containing protein n=1 Tax=Oricola sp. TaxID=1979950 RepID=UPI003BAD1119
MSPDDATKAAGSVRADRTPAGKVVHYTHVGPYKRLSESYHKMMGWVRMEGLRLAVPTWEVYVDDPDTTPEKELRTEVYVAVS